LYHTALEITSQLRYRWRLEFIVHLCRF